jgi:Tfp pilus assembly protein PilN
MSTTTTVRTGTFPKVNLLPPEIEEHRRFRQVQVGLGVAVVAALVAAGGLTLAAQHQVSSAKDDLASAQAQSQVLQAREAQYANVPKVNAQVDAAKAQLTLAMGKEIRWSYLLNDLSLTIPNHVWLTKVVVAENLDPTTTTTPDATSYLQPHLGSINFEGFAVTHEDLAAWLSAIAKQDGYTQNYLTESKTTLEAEDSTAGGGTGVQHKVVSWKSQVAVNDKALSKRYTEKAGS